MKKKNNNREINTAVQDLNMHFHLIKRSVKILDNKKNVNKGKNACKSYSYLKKKSSKNYNQMDVNRKFN